MLYNDEMEGGLHYTAVDKDSNVESDSLGETKENKITDKSIEGTSSSGINSTVYGDDNSGVEEGILSEKDVVNDGDFVGEIQPNCVYGDVRNGFENSNEDSEDESVKEGLKGEQNLVKRYFTAPREKIREMAEIFGEPEENLMEEYKVFKAKKLFKKLDYFITDLPFSDENFKARCLLADKYSMFGVTVFPTAVAAAKGALAGKISVRAIISYPYGEDIFKVKLKAIKEAVKNGADGITVVLSSGAILRGNYKEIAKEIKKYIKAAKNRRFTVAVDSSKLTPLQTERCCTAMKAIYGVHSMAIFSSNAGGMVRIDAVKDVVKSLDNKLSVEAIGEVSTLDGAIDYFKNGVNGLTSKNGVDIAVDAENKISVKTA